MKLQPNTKHKLKRASASGHGSWLQCADCGGTKHSGFWWLAGYKSKEEPPCWPNNLNDWISRALIHSNGDA